MGYARFGSMILTSTVVMFGLMYLNTYALNHVFYSQTRTWMALVMGATMAVVMMLFILEMYKSKRANVAIILAAVAVFAGALWLVRSQETVSDVAYTKAMIPRHSIAILTSERATSATRAYAASPTTSSRPRSARSAR
jgi:predicted membrane protein